MFHKFMAAFVRQHFILRTRNYYYLEMVFLMTNDHSYSIPLLNLQLHQDCNYQALAAPPSLIAATSAGLEVAVVSTRQRTLSLARHAIG